MANGFCESKRLSRKLGKQTHNKHTNNKSLISNDSSARHGTRPSEPSDLNLCRPLCTESPRTRTQARADRLESALDELSRNAETAMAADESRRAIHRAAAEAHAEDLLSAQARPFVLPSPRVSVCVCVFQ
jgi:hypothetical protein